MTNNKNTSLRKFLTVVIVCYDPYWDAIELSPLFLDKYWPNCSPRVLYVTSEIEKVGNHETITTKGNLSFRERLVTALKNVATDYVMVLLDDYLISKPVDENKIQSVIEFMENNGAYYCELYTMFSRPRGVKVQKDFLLISKKRKYRINLQPSIFRKELLLDALSSENVITAWDLELEFSKGRFIPCDAYYSLNHSFSILNYIDKGLVTRKAYKVIKKEKLWYNQRKVWSVFQTFKRFVVSRTYLLVPESLKRRFKKSKIYDG